MTSPGHHVFISYARSDAQQMNRVRGIVSAMAPSDSVFVDSMSILPGSDWKDALAKALATSQIVFLVWTRAASKSDWVQKEIEVALALYYATGVPRIVPIAFAGVPLPEALSSFQIVEMGTEHNETSWHTRVLSAGICGLGLLVATFLLVVGVAKVSAAALFVSTWLAVLAFSALRTSVAPWSIQKSDQVHALFSTIKTHRSPALATLFAAVIVLLAACLQLLLR